LEPLASAFFILVPHIQMFLHFAIKIIQWRTHHTTEPNERFLLLWSQAFTRQTLTPFIGFERNDVVFHLRNYYGIIVQQLSRFRNSKAVQLLLHFERVSADTPRYLMAAGRPPKDANYVERIRVTYRLRPEMVQAIKKNAQRRKISQTAYVELALEEWMKTQR
jgi:hypothetical protein